MEINGYTYVGFTDIKNANIYREVARDLGYSNSDIIINVVGYSDVGIYIKLGVYIDINNYLTICRDKIIIKQTKENLLYGR